LDRQFERYFHEAKRLQKHYAGSIEILVGFETEWIQQHYEQKILQLLAKYRFDMFVGSIHHVRGIPIDIDRRQYEAARMIAGGTEELLFEAYFDEQLEMLQALKPPIVGHFDVIRLWCDEPTAPLTALRSACAKAIRNLKFIAEYGGLIELNSAALRKGHSEAYPSKQLCHEFARLGGRFTLSDDAHCIEHIGQNYDKVLEAMAEMGIATLSVLRRDFKTFDGRFPNVGVDTVSVNGLREDWL
jgi:histidinol-phosphatase (PHP family)